MNLITADQFGTIFYYLSSSAKKMVDLMIKTNFEKLNFALCQIPHYHK
jgi:hypothetical protein